jgi:hypothetical protein
MTCVYYCSISFYRWILFQVAFVVNQRKEFLLTGILSLYMESTSLPGSGYYVNLDQNLASGF